MSRYSASSTAAHASIIFDKIQDVKVTTKEAPAEERRIRVTIRDFSSCLQVKIRDVNMLTFNFNLMIDSLIFGLMRKDQCLEIAFDEFRSHLLEMLQQVTDKEMLLKCDVNENDCKFIFYEKSKIKDLILLVISLAKTDQDEIFEEMNDAILQLQDANRSLQDQLRSSKSSLNDHKDELRMLTGYNRQILHAAYRQVQEIESVYQTGSLEFTSKVCRKFSELELKLNKLKLDTEVVRKESILKSASSARILQSMENLRLETIEYAQQISDYKQQISSLTTVKYENERLIGDLRKSLHEREKKVQDYQRQTDALKADLQEATIIIAEKTKTNNELAKDLLQANQMLVNFNNQYDQKAKENEELLQITKESDQLVREVKNRYRELADDYGEYKKRFSAIREESMRQELDLARKRIEDLEKQNREAVKMNGLLSKKLSAGSLINFEKM